MPRPDRGGALGRGCIAPQPTRAISPETGLRRAFLENESRTLSPGWCVQPFAVDARSRESIYAAPACEPYLVPLRLNRGVRQIVTRKSKNWAPWQGGTEAAWYPAHASVPSVTRRGWAEGDGKLGPEEE